MQTKITNSFQTPVIEISEAKAQELPAFDMIRASINLAVAGILISIATSMKLPLYYQKATSRPHRFPKELCAGLFDDCQGKLKVQ